MNKTSHTPIFNENFLKQEINNTWNEVSSLIPDIVSIKQAIQDWAKQLPVIEKENKKEEEVRPEFAKIIFEEALQYQGKFNIERHFVYEQKVQNSGKKSDFALGYFKNDKQNVLVVGEIKGIEKEKLDEKQGKYSYSMSPVEQSFNYCHKHNGNCKWIIVTNFKELRLYRANNSCEYEQFNFNEIASDDFQFKKFIFLLHKDRLIAKIGNSRIETLFYVNKEYKKSKEKEKSENHIIDQLYHYFEKFINIPFIDPNFVAKCNPFHKTYLLNRGFYYNYCLYSNNPEIFKLFNNLTIGDNSEILINEDYKHELIEKKIKDFEKKIRTVIEKLNDCLIQKIKPQDLRGFKEISCVLPQKNTICDCLHCSYESFEFPKLISKLNDLKGKTNYSIEDAYMFTKIPLDNYKWAYRAYMSIWTNSKKKNDQNSSILATYNLKYLTSHFYNDYKGTDRQEIISKLRDLDLYQLIHYSLDYAIDKEVRDYYLRIIENRFYKTLEYEIDEKIERIINIYDKSHQTHEPYHYSQNEKALLNYFNLLLSYTRQNSLTFDKFGYYSKLIYKIFKGFIASYASFNPCDCRIISFNYTMLINAIIYIEHDTLKKLFSEFNISEIQVDNETYFKIIKSTGNLLKSIFSTGFCTTENTDVTNLLKSSIWFKQDFDRFFNNLFLLLNYLEIKSKYFNEITKSIYPFIQYYTGFKNSQHKEFQKFIFKNAGLFSKEQLMNLLNLALDKQDEELLECISYSIIEHYPYNELSNTSIIYKILSTISDDEYNDIRCYLPIYKLLNKNDKTLMFSNLESRLNAKFDSVLYRDLVLDEVINLDNKSWLNLFFKDLHKSILRFYERDFRVLGEKEYPEFFVIDTQIIYMNDLFNCDEVKQFKNLPEFETWLLNPFNFDYDKFSTDWLFRVNGDVFMLRLKEVEKIRIIILTELKSKPDNILLSELYFKYFAD